MRAEVGTLRARCYSSANARLLEIPPAPEALLEEGEVDAAVAAVLDEARVLREVVCLAVLEDKEAFLLEQVVAEDDVGQLGELRQGVRRVGKDEVELLATLCEVLEDVAADGKSRRVLQLVEELADEAVVAHVELNADDAAATSAHEFQRDATRPGKEVESRRPLAEVEIALQDVEEVFLREVRRRACREAARHIEMPAFVFACDDSHSFGSEK